MERRAIAYVRKSTVEVERRSLGEQEADLRQAADRLGLVIVRVLAEEASAYAERERPVFTEALRAIERGEADALLCWSLDRFSRRGAGHVMGLVDKGLRLVTLDGIDTAQESGRMQVAVMAEVARSESQRISARVRRAKAAARAEGRWHAGPPPFGYRVEGRGRAIRLVVHEEEAAVVREVARRIEAGASLASTVQWLNAEGHRTRRGNLWASISLKGLLRSPTLAGWLPHRGDVVRDEEGRPVTAHEAILPPDVWRRVQRALDLRAASAPEESRAAGGRPRSRPLSGLLRCPCGSVMTVRSGAYSCAGPRPRGDRHHVTVRTSVEDLLARMVLRRLAALDPEDPALEAVAGVWAALSGQTDGDAHERRIRQDQVDTAREELDRVVGLYARGLLEDEDAERLLPDLKRRLRQAEARLLEFGPTTVDVSFLLDLGQTAADPEDDPVGPGSAWAALDTETKRAVMAAVVERVEVQPTGRGRRDVERRLRVVWRDGGPPAEDSSI